MGPRLSATVRNGAEWLRRFVGTTPGVLVALTAVTVVLCLISGFVCANQLNGKIARSDAVLERTEPVAYAAQRLYVALSSADAAAAAAFLSGGIEAPAVRARYRLALAEAATALAEATSGATDAETRSIVARISAELPAYTGLVEAARANNRQGFPVGSAYLREASTVMQTSLLPSAEQLTTSRFAAVRADQRAIASVPWASIGLLLLVLITCAAGSFMLLRRTNRRMNIGVIAAGGAAVLALLWMVVAIVAVAHSVDGGSVCARARFETLANARILAQQARADETLQLITRGEVGTGERSFTQHTDRLRDHLQAVTGSDSVPMREFTQWSAGHRKQIEAYQAADYPAAVDQAIGSGSEASAAQFTGLDEALRDGIAQARAELRDEIGVAGHRLTMSPAGTLVLMMFAAVAVVAGLWPRLQEFL